MLTDRPIKAVAGDLPRQWMFDDYFDLIVWYERGDAEQIHGFQLVYDREGNPRALTWMRSGEFFHAAVDTGEQTPLANRTPILVADGSFPSAAVSREFLRRSELLDHEIRELVVAKIAEFALRSAPHE